MCIRKTGGMLMAVYLLFMATGLPAVSYYTEVLQAGRIRVKATTELRCRAVGFFVSRCSDRIDRILGIAGQPSKTLTVIESMETDDEEEGEKNSVYRVRFRPDMNNVEVVHSLIHALFMRRELELPKDMEGVGEIPTPSRRAKSETPTTDWLAAAVTHRILMEEMGGVGLMSKDYEVVRNQYSLREFPSVDMLLGGGIDVEFRPLFELYMLHCDLLLLCLETLRGSQTDLFRQLLQGERIGREPLAVFDEVFGKYYAMGKGRQELYERRVAVVSRQRHRGGGTEMVAERVEELETVQMVGGSGPEVLKRVRLEDMPKVLEDYKADIRAFLKLEQRFKDLQADAPYWLRKPLGQYVESLQLLREGKMHRFKREFKKARESFQTELTKQRKLDGYLDEYERKMVSANVRLDDFMEVLQRYHEISDSLYTKGEVFPK